MTRERNLCIALAVCPGLESSTLRKLVRALGSAEAVWDEDPAVWRQAVRMQDSSVQRLDSWRRNMKLPERVVSHLEQQEVQVLFHQDIEFPRGLHDLDDAPLVLFARGDVSLLQRPSVAIVGTRRASSYGIEAARFVSETLAKAGLTVVSGMALGIDAAAHESAIETSGSTIAVLGCGIDICYPPSHRALYHRIITQQGLIVSEYPPGKRGQKYYFPERNRLIAALGQITVVIQAGEKSGALRTVDSALELGRDVYVVPGPITSLHFRGSHRLLQQGAIPLLDPHEVLSDLGVVHDPVSQIERGVPKRWELLYEEVFESSHAGHIALALGWPPSTVYAGLLELELGGWLTRRSDGSYERRV
jgi:DNA processing protein